MKAIKVTSIAAVGFFLGIAWTYIAFHVMPQHGVSIALDACFTEAEPHAVTRLAWDIWASDPWRYPVAAPLYIQRKMTPLGASAAFCMWEQMDPTNFEEIVRGQR